MAILFYFPRNTKFTHIKVTVALRYSFLSFWLANKKKKEIHLCMCIIKQRPKHSASTILHDSNNVQQ